MAYKFWFSNYLLVLVSHAVSNSILNPSDYNPSIENSKFQNLKQSSFNLDNLLFNPKKQPSFLKNVTLLRYQKYNRRQPKIVLVNVSSLSNLPPLPYLSSPFNQERERENEIDFIYDDLKFYLASSLTKSQLSLTYAIAEQKDDFIDLVIKKEQKSLLNNTDKLINYLQFKEIVIINKLKNGDLSLNYLGNQEMKHNQNKEKAFELLCKSKLSIDVLLRMFILNEWINKQSNKQNFFEFKPKTLIESNFKKIKDELLNRICVKEYLN